MTGSAVPQRVASVGNYELWMLAQAALGFIVYGGVIFLIPLHVLAQGGTPGDTGAVIALIGVLGLAGPVIGGLADRFRAYRSLQLASLVLVALGALGFAYAYEDFQWLGAAGLVGLGMSSSMVLNTTFVVGAGFTPEQESKKLALLQLSMPAGQVLGLAVIASLAALGFGISAMFVVMAAAGLLFALLLSLVNGPAANRLGGVVPAEGAEEKAPAARPTLSATLLSQFGLTLALTFLIYFSSEGIESQYATYMDSVFGLDPEYSATALSVIMLITIPLYLIAGRWTARAGPRPPFILSAAVRAVAGACLLMLPSSQGFLALLAFGFIMFVFPFFELNAAVLASKTSPIGQAAGQGSSMAAYSLAAIVGSIAAGWLAEYYGFASLAAITVVAAGAAAVVGLLMLRSPESQPDKVSPQV